MSQNHGPAILAIGRWYDPAHYSAESSPFSAAQPRAGGDLLPARERRPATSAADDDLRTLCASEHAESPWSAQLCPPGQ